MATEHRRIVFTHPETTAAIRQHGANQGITFPNGKVIRARFAGNAEYEFHSMKLYKSPLQMDYNVQDTSRAITLTFFDDVTFEQKYINVTANFVSAALIEYCVANRIMMPKRAEKVLDLTEFNICMDIKMENETNEASTIASITFE